MRFRQFLEQVVIRALTTDLEEWPGEADIENAWRKLCRQADLYEEAYEPYVPPFEYYVGE